MHRSERRRGVQLIVSGGIRNGADVAKALALGADAVAIGTAALIALGDNHPALRRRVREARQRSGFLRRLPGRQRPGGDQHAGSRAGRPASTRWQGGRRLANYLRVLTMEAQTIARACGKSHVCHLEPEDLVAVTHRGRGDGHGCRWPGTDWIPGQPMSDTADVVIVGGGIEGAAAAWALAERGVTDVVVAERNTVGSGMTGKSSGIVRCHYGVSSLAAMATVGLEVFEKADDLFGTDIGFRQTGYVVGVGEPNVDALRKSLAAQRAVGVQTEEIDHAEVATMWPFADLTPFAAFGWEPRGGYGDAYQTAQALAVSARARRRLASGRAATVTGLLVDRRPGDRRARWPTAPRSRRAPSSSPPACGPGRSSRPTASTCPSGWCANRS